MSLNEGLGFSPLEEEVGLLNDEHETSVEEVMLLENDDEDALLARALEESLRTAPSTHQISRNHVENGGGGVLYAGKDAEGFDMFAGRNWIYPTNYPVRQYQYDIVQSALFKNTLVSLPTGLGKTFIAAVVMYNFYRWYPRGKIIFMAPTKPLVNQQINSCYKVMGIPQNDTAEMTGSMSPAERVLAWQKKRVFFLTPQVLTNDLARGACQTRSIKCIVVDEAHKALGNHSYCQVMKSLIPFNNKFRVLALSATPGSDMQAVMQVVNNLLIAHVELRNEDSPDIVQFTHKRNIDTVIVALGPYISSIRERFLVIVDKYLGYLQRQKVLYGHYGSLTKYGLLQARVAFRQNPPSNIPRSQYGNIESHFAVGVTLMHCLELLSQYGLRSFLRFIDGVLKEERGQAVVQGRLKQDDDLETLLQELRELLGPQNQEDPEPDVSMAVPSSGQLRAPYTYSHPKLEKLQDIVVAHFTSFKKNNIPTRVMIFCQYRDTVIEVCHNLQKHHPLVKPMTFIGQSSVGKQSKGFTQKQQLKVMQKFRGGGYNTLISTCVGEEGLDIGDVDLIVCFDAHKSPIRLVQRMGRTGRKREGRIVMLVTEGKEHSKYKSSMYQNRSMNKKLLEGNRLTHHLYNGNPRMIPEGTNPECLKMHITVPTFHVKETKKTKNKDIRSMFDKPSGSKESGIGKTEIPSPYCTSEDLANMDWDGKTVPEFNKIPDIQELFAKDKGELKKLFNDNSVLNEGEEIEKLDFGEWLDWQKQLQHVIAVEHSDNTNILVDILNYADKKRNDLQPTQVPGLMSQVNPMLTWRKNGRKKGTAKQKSVAKKKEKQLPLKGFVTSIERNLNFSMEKDVEGIPIIDYFKRNVPKVPVTNRPLNTSKNVNTNGSNLVKAIEVTDVLDNSTEAAEITEDVENTLNVSRGGNSCKSCYFCKMGLFNCQLVKSDLTSQNKLEDFGEYEFIDLSLLNDINRESIAALDLNLLLTPPCSPISEHGDDALAALQISRNLGVNESAALIADELMNIPSNSSWISELVDVQNTDSKNVCKDPFTRNVTENINDENVKPNSELGFEQCLHNGEFNERNKIIEAQMPLVSDQSVKYMEFMKREELEISIEDCKKREGLSQEEEINMLWKSPVPSCSFSKDSRTPEPMRLNKTDGNCNIAEPAVSPILCSQRSSKKGSQKEIRNLPICSTPKIHRKNLFFRNTVVDDVKENEEIVTYTNDSPTRKKSMVDFSLTDDVEELFVGVPSSVCAPPKANFDLISSTQLFGIEDEDHKSVDVTNKTNSSTNSTLYSVTQFINLVDNKANPRSTEMSNSKARSVQVKGLCDAVDVSRNNMPATVETLSLEIRKIKNSSDKGAKEQTYFHDSDDDLFADLPIHSNDNWNELMINCGQPKVINKSSGLEIEGKNCKTIQATFDLPTGHGMPFEIDSNLSQSRSILSTEKVDKGISFDRNSPNSDLKKSRLSMKHKKKAASDEKNENVRLSPKCTLDPEIEEINFDSEIFGQNVSFQSKQTHPFVPTDVPHKDHDNALDVLQSSGLEIEGKNCKTIQATFDLPTGRGMPFEIDSNLSQSRSILSTEKVDKGISFDRNSPNSDLKKSRLSMKHKKKAASDEKNENVRLSPKCTLDPEIEEINFDSEIFGQNVSFQSKQTHPFVPTDVPHKDHDNALDVLQSSGLEIEGKNCKTIQATFDLPTGHGMPFEIDSNLSQSRSILSTEKVDKGISFDQNSPNSDLKKSRLSMKHKKKAASDEKNENVRLSPKCTLDPEIEEINFDSEIFGQNVSFQSKQTHPFVPTDVPHKDRDNALDVLQGFDVPLPKMDLSSKRVKSESFNKSDVKDVRKNLSVVSDIQVSVSSLDEHTNTDIVRKIENKSVLLNKSHSTLPEEDSLIMQPVKRGKRANISSSSSSNDCESSPKKLKLFDENTIKNAGSASISDSGWLTVKQNSIKATNIPLLKNKGLENHKLKSGVKTKERVELIQVLSSDESDFESQAVKQKRQENTAGPSRKKKDRGERGGKKSKKSEKRCVFLESEAEESYSCPSSSDGENTSGLDGYDSSFVSESSSHAGCDANLQAKFLNSVIRSPGGRHGKFKIPTKDPPVPLEDVYSQQVKSDSSYLEDSFCVDEAEESEILEVSLLEVAEAILDEERKRKRSDSDIESNSLVRFTTVSSDAQKKSLEKDSIRSNKCRKRIILLSSDSEDDVRIVSPVMHQTNSKKEACNSNALNQDTESLECKNDKNLPSVGNKNVKPDCALKTKSNNESMALADFVLSEWDYDFAFSTDQQKEECTSTGYRLQDEGNVAPSANENVSKAKVFLPHPEERRKKKASNFDVSTRNTTIIMAARQVASAPEISTALRAQHGIEVLVRSVTDASYIISWKLGVIRITLTDFMKACGNQSGLRKMVNDFRSYFMKQMLIVENDKLTPLATSIGTRSVIWNKSAIKVLGYLQQAKVSVLFSADKADTARLLAKLAQVEREKQCGIIDVPQDRPEISSHLQVYLALPCVNMALAMRICRMFSTFTDFLDGCDSVKKLKEVLGLDDEKAVQIYLVLNHTMKPRG